MEINFELEIFSFREKAESISRKIKIRLDKLVSFTLAMQSFRESTVIMIKFINLDYR